MEEHNSILFWGRFLSDCLSNGRFIWFCVMVVDKEKKYDEVLDFIKKYTL